MFSKVVSPDRLRHLLKGYCSNGEVIHVDDAGIATIQFKIDGVELMNSDEVELGPLSIFKEGDEVRVKSTYDEKYLRPGSVVTIRRVDRKTRNAHCINVIDYSQFYDDGVWWIKPADLERITNDIME